MLYLAFSCLQGRPMTLAYQELLKLDPDGIQLTPGNIPTPNFQEEVKIPYRLHHGFSWTERKREVWNDNNEAINIEKERSIHPPMKGDFNSWIQNVGDHILEIMYPGDKYLLSNDEQVNTAMDFKKRLAIDISHINIMFKQKEIGQETLDRLLSYNKICEIHVSHNAGNFDTHRLLIKESFLLEWAKSKLKDLPVVYESYFHKLTDKEREHQIKMVRM